MATSFEQVAISEHRFWLQILGDHSRFIFESLAPSETNDIQHAHYFIQTFDQLLQQVDGSDLLELSILAQKEVMKLRDFKLSIIERLLVGKIKIHLSPTFVSHMVSELEEYVRILQSLTNRQVPPPTHPLHHHLIWLLDAAGHAGAIADNMDQVEKILKKKGQKFLKEFEQFYLKAVEMTGYLRTNLTSFPALERFNQETSMEMVLFMNFLHELEELELNAQALGTFAPLMADHMMREECYYLTKLAETTELALPNCNPGKPRIEEG